MVKDMSKFTVGTIVYNQKKQLQYFLDVLRKHLYPLEQDFDVAIADDGSSDGTQKFIEKYKQSCPFLISYFWQPDEGFRCGKAKQEVGKMARGEYLIMYDGDDVPALNALPNYLEVMGRAPEFLRHQVGYFGPRHRVDKQYLQDAYLRIANHITQQKDWREARGMIGNIPPKSPSSFSGSNFMVPTETFNRVQWPDLNGFGHDDWIFSEKFVAQGGYWVYLPEAVSYHVDHPNTNPPPVTRAAYESVKAEIATFTKNFV